MYKNGVYEIYQTETLEKIEPIIAPVSEMAPLERFFLNGLCRKEKPQTILEVGVASGASSAIMLNASREFGTMVYSIDLFNDYYRDARKPVGFIVEESIPELKTNWKLFKGGHAYSFLENIGIKFDMCLLDTSHTNPGEILDYLQILPYLREGGILVIHDIALYTLIPHYHSRSSPEMAMMPFCTTCAILFATLKGKKFTPTTDIGPQANIGAIKLDKEQFGSLDEIFHLLTLPWYENVPDDRELSGMREFFARKYGGGGAFLRTFDEIVSFQRHARMKGLFASGGNGSE